MATLKLGTNAVHDIDKGGDGRTGKVVGRQDVKWLDGSEEHNIVIEYTDAAGQTSQAWFPEDACTAVR